MKDNKLEVEEKLMLYRNFLIFNGQEIQRRQNPKEIFYKGLYVVSSVFSIKF